jgi:CheY-like chemotaxis protein
LDVASDGVEAMAFLRQEGPHRDAARPDLILLDFNLPRMDGREVLAHIKSDSGLMTIQIVILTTSTRKREGLEIIMGLSVPSRRVTRAFEEIRAPQVGPDSCRAWLVFLHGSSQTDRCPGSNHKLLSCANYSRVGVRYQRARDTGADGYQIQTTSSRVVPGTGASASSASSIHGSISLLTFLIRGARQEWAIRLAVGATSHDLQRLVLRQSVRYAAAGSAVGIVLLIVVASPLSSALYGIAVWDPAVAGGTALLLAVVCVLAAALPARDAARIAPAEALQR